MDRYREREAGLLQCSRIQLEQQTRLYAYDKRKRVTGSIDIAEENSMARVLLAVQNLRDCSRDGRIYKLFFIGRKSGASVYHILGDVQPDCRGNAGLTADIDINNVDGEGTELSCFYIFLLAAVPMEDTKLPLQAVLKGDVQADRETGQKMTTEPDRSYNSYYSRYIMEKTAALIAGTSGTAPVEPFDRPWVADRWKRAEGLRLIPVASSGAEKQIMKYGHFIFAYDDRYFYFAVPGMHTEEEWPDKGASGFLMWQSIKNSREYGYWCMVIDRKAGIITEIS